MKDGKMGYLIPILQRPKRVDCATWAELNRFMPSTHTLFSFLQTPFFREPTRYLSDLAGTCRVILCTPAQVGKTTAIENFLGWIAAYDRANTLLIFDRLKTGQKMSKNRLRPFLRDVCGINATGQTGTKYRNPDASKEVCNISLATGANLMIGSSSSASDLCSTPAKFLCCDELDRWKDEIKGEGDPVALALQRQMRFRGMALFTSTPTIETGRIHQHFMIGTQETWGVVCSGCGAWFDCRWDSIDWSGDVPTVHCPKCGEVFDEMAVRALEHRYCEPQNPNPIHDEYGRVVRSYRVFGTLCDAFYSWRGLRELERSALALGEANYQSFRNTRLGEIYVPRSDRIIYGSDIQRIAVHDYHLDALPRDIVFCTAGIDTQDNGFAMEICGWNRDASRAYGIEWLWLDGDPKKPEIWHALTDIIERRRYKREDGKTLGVIYAAQDSGGHHTNRVYAYSLRHPRHLSVKGYVRLKETIPFLYSISTQKLSSAGNGTGKIKLHIIGVNTGKDMLLDMISKTLDGERCLSWPHDFSCNYDANYFEQLTSEKRTNTPRGVRWELLPGRRNEALDCRIYAMYAAHLLLSQRGAIASIMEFEGMERPQPTTEKSSEVTPSNPVKKPEPAPVAPNSEPPKPKPDTPKPLPKRHKFKPL